MKKLNLTFVFCVTVFFLSAQDITITFQSKVDTVSIDSIRATNLRTNQTVKLLVSESLLLVKTPTGINPVLEIIETGYIYPNPSNEDANFCFSTNKSEEVEINMYNTNGQLLKQNRLFLEQGTHRFDLKFPVAGIYFLSVAKSEGTASFKAVYTGNKIQTGSIQYAGSEKLNSQKTFVNQLKSATSDIALAYTEGDIIHYSFFSGVNTTIVTDIPAKSKTIDAEFVKCIDNDNKSYKTVKIGEQIWMAENLAYLPSVSPSSAGSYTDPYYYVYDYQGTNVAAAKQNANYTTYGVLYNWPAAMAVCPPGWHLPTDAEWAALEHYLIANGFNYDGTTTGNKIAKSLATTTKWDINSGTGSIGNNLSLNNKSGFSAFPGGYRNNNDIFTSTTDLCQCWSSTENNTGIAWSRTLSYSYGYFYRSIGLVEYGFSVRCVRDNTDAQSLSVITSAITSITQTTATSGGNVTADGSTTVIARGVCWNTSGNPTTSDSKTNNGTGPGSYESNLTGLTAKTLYYMRAYATNSKATAYGNEVTFTTSPEGNLTGTFIDSRDGYVYKTVKIGNQTWMAENLAYLPAVSPSSAGSYTDPYYYVYDYQGTNVAAARQNANYTTYGVLYNWPAAKTACPPGWQLPTDAEWTVLENYLIANGYNYDGTTTGNKIAKSLAATTQWDTYSETGAIGNNLSLNNKSGFSALPGGYRVGVGTFYRIGVNGDWWSSKETSESTAWSRGLYYYYGGVLRNYDYFKQLGFSVRCVRDNTDAQLSVTTSAITSITQSTATGGGNVTADGGATVIARGVCWNTTGNPTTSDRKTNNGTGTGSYESNLTGLTAKTSYYVRAYATNSAGTAYGNEVTFTTSPESNLTGTFTDSRDGQVYKTIKIGDQVWMAENLAYLPAVSPSSAGSNTDPYYYVYDYQGTDVAAAKQNANYTIYGVLYNWPAAKAACPPGWHFPSDAEWSTLENYLIANGFNYDGTTTGNIIAKSLAATTHWNTYSGYGTIGNNLSLNNKTGFSALPGGSRYGNGAFGKVGDSGLWLSSTENSTGGVWSRNLNHFSSSVSRGYLGKEYGYSVRCVRD